MKLPEYIKRSVRLACKYQTMANQHNNLIRDWMEKNNLYNDGNIDQLIDTLEMGSGDPGDFVVHMENDALEGNDHI